MKKILISISIVIVIVVLGSIFIFRNTDTNKQQDMMEKLLKAYYNVDGAMDIAQNEDYFVSLYKEKYESILTQGGYDNLVLNRAITDVSKITKDYKCELELADTEFSKLANTVEGHPSYSYKAYIDVKFSDGKIEKVVDSGTINFTLENNKWIIKQFNIPKGELLLAVKDKV